MEVIVAKSAGFCFGVRRAVDEVYRLLETEKDCPLYTYGPIIHNEEVVSDLQRRGVQVVSEEELEGLSRGIIVIRSHGVGRLSEERMRSRGLRVVDMTCPFVKKIHRIVERQSGQGKQVIIAGNREHPEVQGIMGWCREPAIVVKDAQEAGLLELSGEKEYLLVAQTTFHYTKFQNIVDLLEKKGYNINCVNTICNATKDRQEEAARIASSVDGMLVIGGSCSSNTQKLYQICKKECMNTHYIQTAEDLDHQWFLTAERVGVTGGASTPNIIIEEVLNHVR